LSFYFSKFEIFVKIANEAIASCVLMPESILILIHAKIKTQQQKVEVTVKSTNQEHVETLSRMIEELV